MKVAISQPSPIWMNKMASIEKLMSEIEKAGNENADLIVFGEGFVPGYPFWLSFTNVAEFDSELQKEMFSIYHQNAINVGEKDLKAIQKSFKQLKNWLLFRSN